MGARRRNPLEWAVFALCAAVVAGTVGALLYWTAALERTPPALVVVLGAPEAREEGWAVPVEVHNTGQTTAEAVAVEVALRDGATHAVVELEMPYLPHGSVRRGVAVFEEDPTGGGLSARVLSHRTP